MRINLRYFTILLLVSVALLFACSKKDQIKSDTNKTDKKSSAKRGSWAQTEIPSDIAEETDSNDNQIQVVEEEAGEMDSSELEDEMLASTSLNADDTKSDAEEDAGKGSDKETGVSQKKLVELQKVYFDYDSSDIKNDARDVLQVNAEIIQNDISGDILIEGHCDERGTDEYNLALGQRRAESVKRYLVTFGISDMKLTTISYGETKPEVDGHDESAWRLNRRAVLKEITE